MFICFKHICFEHYVWRKLLEAGKCQKGASKTTVKMLIFNGLDSRIFSKYSIEATKYNIICDKIN